MKHVLAVLVSAGLLIGLAGCYTTNASITTGYAITPEAVVFNLSGSGTDPLGVQFVIESTLRDYGFETVRNGSGDTGSAESQPSTGTAFSVSADGFLVTSAHVVSGASHITVLVDRVEYVADVVFADEDLDIALLRARDLQSEAYLQFAGSDLASGTGVLVAGYPLSQILGSEVRVTRGNVAAASGIRGDTRVMQITAPVQPGNSGGPVLTQDMYVSGVVASRLSDSAVFGATGSLPQNVNFAVKSSIVAEQVEFILGPPDPELRATTLPQALSATHLVLVNERSSNDRAQRALGIQFSYNSYWDVIHYTLRRLDLRLIDAASGNTVGWVTFSGGSLDNYETIVRNAVNQMIQESLQ